MAHCSAKFMRTRALFLQLSQALACLFLGIVIDRRLLSPRATPVRTNETRVAAKTNTVHNTQPRATARPSDEPSSRLTSVAQVEAALAAALTNRTFGDRQLALELIASSVEPGLIAQVLNLAERIPAGSLRHDFMKVLI